MQCSSFMQIQNKFWEFRLVAGNHTDFETGIFIEVNRFIVTQIKYLTNQL